MEAATVAGKDPTPLGEALDKAPMSRRHVRFWLLAGLGIMLDGFDFFIIGVANPLIAQDFGTSDAVKGLVSAAAIVGAIFGAALLGPIADKVGRRRIFKFDLWLFVVFSIACVFAWDVWVADRLPLHARGRDRARLPDRGQLPRRGAAGA